MCRRPGPGIELLEHPTLSEVGRPARNTDLGCIFSHPAQSSSRNKNNPAWLLQQRSTPDTMSAFLSVPRDGHLHSALPIPSLSSGCHPVGHTTTHASIGCTSSQPTHISSSGSGCEKKIVCLLLLLHAHRSTSGTMSVVCCCRCTDKSNTSDGLYAHSANRVLSVPIVYYSVGDATTERQKDTRSQIDAVRGRLKACEQKMQPNSTNTPGDFSLPSGHTQACAANANVDLS